MKIHDSMAELFVHNAYKWVIQFLAILSTYSWFQAKKSHMDSFWYSLRTLSNNLYFCILKMIEFTKTILVALNDAIILCTTLLQDHMGHSTQFGHVWGILSFFSL